MSRHHIDQKWSTFTRKRRIELAAQLPLPCIDAHCVMGGTVWPDPPTEPGMRKRPTTWHVGHISAASAGGRPTRENTGPVHALCNLQDGGRRGAAVVNDRRRADVGIRPW